MFLNGKQLKQARQLVKQGDLNRACQLVSQSDFSRTSMGRRIAKQIIDRLVDRADRSSFSGDLSSAWRDLSDASSIAVEKNADRVSKKTTSLIDRTIDLAQSLLVAGKPVSANTAIDLLEKRNILDRRANEVKRICNLITEADQMAARGQLKDASSLLMETKQLRPDLTYLDSRIRNFGYQQSKLSELTSELRFAINESAWNGASEVTNRILQIAPAHQIALDARRRCANKQANPVKSLHRIFDSQASSGNSLSPANLNDTQCDDSSETGITVIADNVAEEFTLQNQSDKTAGNMKSFMLWIDGVGGFLVCTEPEVTFGRAVPGTKVNIPVQADLRREHFQIKRVEDQYVATSLAEPDGQADQSEPSNKQGSLDWQLLADQEVVQLGHGVSIRFQQTHPLGRSARVEFTSRHRTEPWSDAILLLGDAILLGPNRANHVYCPRWKNQVVIYRRGDQVYLRHDDMDLLEIDGVVQEGDIPLTDGLLIVGQEYSITCEQVGRV